MEQPLIAPAWRRPALVGAVLGLATFLALAVVVFHGRRTDFDTWMFTYLPEHIPVSWTQFLVGFTDPALSVVLLMLTLVLTVNARRFDLALLAVVGPAVGTTLASDVIKPIVERRLGPSTVYTYPSGHETAVVCTSLVLIIAFAQLPVRRAAKWALAAVLVAWTLVAATVLTRYHYHYATDTIGAMGFSVAYLLGLAALIDRYWPSRARTPRERGERRPRPRPQRRPRPVPVPDPEPQLTPRA